MIRFRQKSDLGLTWRLKSNLTYSDKSSLGKSLGFFSSSRPQDSHKEDKEPSHC
jgi:hypothetical protein